MGTAVNGLVVRSRPRASDQPGYPRSLIRIVWYTTTSRSQGLPAYKRQQSTPFHRSFLVSSDMRKSEINSLVRANPRNSKCRKNRLRGKDC